MDGEYVGIAGAYSCHLIGDEKFSILLGVSRGCMAFRDPTALSRFKQTGLQADLSEHIKLIQLSNHDIP